MCSAKQTDLLDLQKRPKQLLKTPGQSGPGNNSNKHKMPHFLEL